jgi:hypothetical protein
VKRPTPPDFTSLEADVEASLRELGVVAQTETDDFDDLVFTNLVELVRELKRLPRIAEVADRMDCPRTTTGDAMRRLVNRGRVHKDGRGLYIPLVARGAK